ncbi:MAG: type II secretion system F family protein [Candidatus Omnitrophica bacterium]|nr:type II secretion system F family protein [Candidatus Omnitrophota bacterium]
MIFVWVACALILIGCALIFLGLYPRAPETVSVFQDKIQQQSGSSFSGLLKWFAPLNLPLIKALRLKDPLNRRFYLAKWKVTPAEFLAGKELLAVIFPLVVYLAFDVTVWYWLALAALVGFILPDVMLNNRVKKRKYEIVRVLPETIDLLGLCVGAGLDFMAAVRWVVDKVKINPMIEELIVVLKEINVGKPRVEALRDMSHRLDIPDVTSFVRTLVQADRMGTPVEEAFRILSEDTRMRRFHRGERQAMKAPMKMLIPLIFCILPVILIIVAGPILIRFVKQGVFSTTGI